MNPHAESHLTYDQQLMALVDPADLNADQQAHLRSCAQCQAQAQKLSRRFERLGRLARQLAPEPSRPFRLPARKAQRRIGWQFKPAWAAGLVGALVLVLALWAPRQFNPTRPGPDQLVRQEEADALLMAEIDDLVRDALPQAYRKLAAVDTPDMPPLTEDLIDWIVPTI